MRALRPQPRAPPPHAFVHARRTRTERQLADRLTAQGRTVTVEPYDGLLDSPGTDPDRGQMDRVIRHGFAGLVALVDEDHRDHVLPTVVKAFMYRLDRIQLRVFTPDRSGLQPPWVAVTDPDQVHRQQPRAPDPPRRTLLGQRLRAGELGDAARAADHDPPWRR